MVDFLFLYGMKRSNTGIIIGEAFLIERLRHFRQILSKIIVRTGLVGVYKSILTPIQLVYNLIKYLYFIIIMLVLV